MNILQKALMLLFAITMACPINADFTAGTSATHNSTEITTVETATGQEKAPKSVITTIKKVLSAPGNYCFGKKRTPIKTAFEVVIYSAAIYSIYKVSSPLVFHAIQLVKPTQNVTEETNKSTEQTTLDNVKQKLEEEVEKSRKVGGVIAKRQQEATETANAIKEAQNRSRKSAEQQEADLKRSQEIQERIVQKAKEFANTVVMICSGNLTTEAAPEHYYTQSYDIGIPYNDEKASVPSEPSTIPMVFTEFTPPTFEEMNAGLQGLVNWFTNPTKKAKSPRKPNKMTIEERHKKAVKQYLETHKNNANQQQ